MNKLFLLTISMIIGSCAYDNAEELYGATNCKPEAISFSQTISPIINANCAISGCHLNGQQLPNLDTYAQIASNTQKIQLRTSNGSMPPASSGKVLSQEEIDLIACWIKSGAPDN